MCMIWKLKIEFGHSSSDWTLWIPWELRILMGAIVTVQ